MGSIRKWSAHPGAHKHKQHKLSAKDFAATGSTVPFSDAVRTVSGARRFYDFFMACRLRSLMTALSSVSAIAVAAPL